MSFCHHAENAFFQPDHTLGLINAGPQPKHDVILEPVPRICNVLILATCLDPWDKPKDDGGCLCDITYWRKPAPHRLAAAPS
ncbi:hypothetical protein DXM27_10210 [Rhizobium rhizogenes]|uniref:Uncharacterized protein n=1 Tax=Rhizobium rhizogenes TaxID=359 RepID=A0AA88JRZ3_RHIRH|nr:hypothetical protein DXM27_10210 [Rhizobium rhizogenes]MQB08793.1 hypothetical protein [Agrobacterium sp. ICMP 6402]